MHLKQRLLCSGVLLVLLLAAWGVPAWAGMLGFPVPRQQPWHVRFELAADSFIEELNDGQATTGRALATVALGLTSWSEIYARLGAAEFNIDEALFSGDFGFAYGGGFRLRLLPLPFGTLGATGQYLRFTSTDHDSAGAKVDGEWEEFDVMLGAGTRRFGGFEFYGGGGYHHSKITLNGSSTVTSRSLESWLPVRLFLGAHFYPLADAPSGRFVVIYEIRFVGEIPQFTLGVQYAF
jgi:Outer membrane protein beta-barrel domain